MIPTSRSARAKLIRIKETSLSLMRSVSFDETTLPVMIIKDLAKRADKNVIIGL